MGAYARERGYERIAELAGRGLDLVTFWGEATEVIAPLVPNYMGPCWFTLDPASLLITSHFNPYMPALPPEALAMEYYEDDVNKLADVVRSPERRLHAARGDGWRPDVQPALAGEHPARGRSGARRGAAHRVGRGLGWPGGLPGGGRGDVRP
jgi:hypothetical protein